MDLRFSRSPMCGVNSRMKNVSSADISAASAVLQALRAAREAFFKVPETAMDQAASYVLRCANKDGGFSYQPPGPGAIPEGRKSNLARTGIGVLCLLACGKSERPEVKRGVEWLRKHPQLMERPLAMAAYSAYYTVLAMYQARTVVGDTAWNEWYPQIQAQILKTQMKDGSFQVTNRGYAGGTWGPEIDSGLMLIALSVQKSLLPLFQR